MYLLLIVAALIVHGSLYPWYFDFATAHSNPFLVLLHSWPSHFDSAARSDAVINVIFYFPLGVVAFLYFARSHTRTGAALMTLDLGLTLSVALELIQVYVPGRVCSLGDVASNVGGTALGLIAGLLLHRPAEALYQFLARRLQENFTSSGTLLLVCWTAYQLFPFTPQIRPYSLAWEFSFLRHPFDLLPAEVWTDIAEWFAVALILRSLLGRMRIWWFVAAVFLRIAVRVLLLTRGFALDELIGVTVALLLWTALPEHWRLRAGLVTMVSAILLRQLSPLHYSHLPTYLGPAGVIFRTGFDYGAVVWMLCLAGWSRFRAGALVVAALAAIVAVQLILPGKSPAYSSPVVAFLMTLGLWLSEVYLGDSGITRGETLRPRSVL